MCGIAGFVYDDKNRPVEMATLRAMGHAIRFRGPDGEGFYDQGGVGFAHRRLGVIDVVGGAQPMSDPTGRFTLCFNGEIYNFKALRRELEALGVQFRTRSDTEVVLLGYRQWGTALAEKLVGMFAFAIWDEREEHLWLCRDRLGVKPLYWTRLGQTAVVFGSTLDAVIAHPEVPRVLNETQFSTFLSISYVPGRDAILHGVERLGAGHSLSWRRGEEPRIACWWDMGEVWQARRRDDRPEAEVREEFGALLHQAVSDRLVSDVPLGAFLSGGLDSSTVVALMRDEVKDLQTFSIGFEQKSFNELSWARRAADALHTKHFDQTLSCADPHQLREIASHFDEPFADTSLIPTYLLSGMAKNHVTVALSGDGGDELLGGYVTLQATAMRRKLEGVPAPLISAAYRLASLLPDSREKVAWTFKIKQFLRGAQWELARAHASWRMVVAPQGLSELLTVPGLNGGAAFAPFEDAYEKVPKLDFLDRFLFVDYRTWLVDGILTKVDRASMAHGLEVRSPFLDHRLVEFCAGLPASLKRRGNDGKVLLKNFARGKVPTECIVRSKQGFNAPVSQWLADSWRDCFESLLEETEAPFERRAVRGWWEEHRKGRRDHGYALFNILMGMLWYDRVRPSREKR